MNEDIIRVSPCSKCGVPTRVPLNYFGDQPLCLQHRVEDRLDYLQRKTEIEAKRRAHEAGTPPRGIGGECVLPKANCPM